VCETLGLEGVSLAVEELLHRLHTLMQSQHQNAPRVCQRALASATASYKRAACVASRAREYENADQALFSVSTRLGLGSTGMLERDAQLNNRDNMRLCSPGGTTRACQQQP